jgi:hypothetical protein
MIQSMRWLAFGLAGAIALSAAAPAIAAPSPPPADVRAKKDEVFNRPEFKSSEVRSNWLLQALRGFFEWLGALYSVARGLFWLLLIGCVVLLLAIIGYAAYAVRRLFGGGRFRQARDGSHAARIVLSRDYRAEAERRAAVGEYTEAVRHLFLSLVYHFDEEGRVSLHKAYTNREYLRLLGERTRARTELRVMVDILDDHWYGQRPSERQQYDESLAVYERLLTAV